VKYAAMFLLLSSLLAVFGLTSGGLGFSALWPAACCLAVSISYLLNSPVIFGKQQSGRLNPLSTVLLLPYLAFTWLTWHIVRKLSRENAYDSLDSRTTIGRRLLARELPDDIKNVVDLTAEFPESQDITGKSNYVAIPILDASVVPQKRINSIVSRIDELNGPTYIHCAQGHGRTGFVTAALMIHRDPNLSVDDAIQRLQNVRPSLSCNKTQIETLRKWQSVG